MSRHRVHQVVGLVLYALIWVLVIVAAGAWAAGESWPWPFTR
jgi:hypothetical protein